MIVNFYKKNGIEARNYYKLIASKNIDCIPQKRKPYCILWAIVRNRQNML